jgi:hypothetical protein
VWKIGVEEEAMKQHLIVGVHVTNRVKDVPKIQAILTEYGCNIRTRLGLHDADETRCSPGGVILLELVGDATRCGQLARKLAAVKGVEVRKMAVGRP